MGDVAAKNKMLVEIGAAKAVEQGFIAIGKFIDTKRNIEAYKSEVSRPASSRVDGS